MDELSSDLDQSSVGGVGNAVRARSRVVSVLDGVGDDFEADEP